MSREKGWMTSGTFAAFCGTTKETLRHYKEIGLLIPAHQGENGYFYYDVSQFYDFYGISIFRLTGMPLHEIRRCMEEKNVDKSLEQLKEQKQNLEQERRRLEQMEFVLSNTIHNWEMGLIPDLVPRIAYFEKEHLLAVPAKELEQQIRPGVSEEEMLIAVLETCKNLCQQHNIQTDYQLGAVHIPGKYGKFAQISHLYTRIKEAADFHYYMEKPAGFYLYLCCRGHWDISEGYGAISQYIEEKGLLTEGAIYACDLAGFMINRVEKNAMSMISVRLKETKVREK